MNYIDQIVADILLASNKIVFLQSGIDSQDRSFKLYTTENNVFYMVLKSRGER